ncbi:defensin [Cryptotermes secundus]|uniref:defensin n=1 Tax=Cryptotermes secundus TaxID=105785 RepID=UPI000CD7DEB3|nr:defensin [Cryptotermes secundus]
MARYIIPSPDKTTVHTAVIMQAVILVLLLVTGSLVHSAPLEEQEDVLLPQPRITCDLLSIEIGGFAFNNSLCAAHCLVKGYKGGSCKDGVCVCRK